MSRQYDRQLGRRLKKLNDQQAYHAFASAVAAHGEDVYNDVVSILRAEFGFGDKRLTRLSEAFQRIQEDTE